MINIETITPDLAEAIYNLDCMPKKGDFVMVLPLKIKNDTEAPVRLVGFIERE